MGMVRAGVPGLVAALLLSACASASPEHSQGEAEPIYGWYRQANGTIHVQVLSNGCTTEESFEPVVMMDSRTRWSFTIEFRRLRPDLCRAYLPEGVELVWTVEGLGLPRGGLVRVINREVPAPGPGR